MSEQEPGAVPKERPGEVADGESKKTGGPGRPQAAPSCDLCGSEMVAHHCKLVCMNCGFVRDCSDP